MTDREQELVKKLDSLTREVADLRHLYSNTVNMYVDHDHVVKFLGEIISRIEEKLR